MKTFDLEIITPEETVFKGQTHSLIVPAYFGYLGIMAGHAPFICGLSNGKAIVRRPEGDVFVAINGGFMETTPQKTVILADEAKILKSNLTGTGRDS